MRERREAVATGSAQVTLADVAREAGVSIATASRAVNGSDRRVRQELRGRVLQAAARLNYAVNTQAQALARGQSNGVSLVVNDIADPYFSSIAAGVVRAAKDRQVLVTVGSTAGRPERELDYLGALRAQRGRAAILAGGGIRDAGLRRALTEKIHAFEARGGRVVVISEPLLPADSIAIENRKGARRLATALAHLGYRRFGILAGPSDLLTAQDRLAGFCDGLSSAGVSGPEAVERGEFTRDGGHTAMSAMLDATPDVECVFAVNDVMAVGAMAACREQGLRLPEDLALAGFGDIVTLRDIYPALTTVRLPLEQIGATALDLALADRDEAAPRQHRFEGDPVIRASTPIRQR
ncbi:LacI family DNA-binding transcriptional regulator [Streptomyces humi]